MMPPELESIGSEIREFSDVWMYSLIRKRFG